MYNNQQAFFEALKKGNDDAYRQLLKETKGFCMNYARHDENARDVLQKVFLDFIGLIETGKYVYERGKISSNFITIFKHRWIDWIRKTNGPKPKEVDEEPLIIPISKPVIEPVELTLNADEIGPDDSTLWLHKNVRNAFGQLGELCQERIVLEVLHGLKQHEIAQKMKISYGVMRNQIRRCRRRFTQFINQNEGQPFEKDKFDALLKAIAQKYIDDNNIKP